MKKAFLIAFVIVLGLSFMAASTYDPKNEVGTTLSSSFVHGTDVAATLTSVSGFPAGGGYIRITGVLTDSEWVLYEYTGVSGSDLTGLTACTEGNVESTASHTFVAGSAVDLIYAAEYLKDLKDIIPNNWYIATHYADLATAVAAIQSDSVTLVIEESEAVTANLTIPTTITLLFLREGLISVQTPSIVYTNGGIQAGLHQIFAGTGGIGGTPRITEAYPQWFGADDTMQTDSAVAINATIKWMSNIATTSSLGGGTVRIVGRFKVESRILLLPKVNIEGVSSARASTWGENIIEPFSRIHNANTSGANCIDITISDDYIGEGEPNYYAPNRSLIKNLYITGNSSSGHGIRIGDPGDGHAPADYTYSKGYNTTVENCLIVGHGEDGIHMSGVPSCKIIGNDIVMNHRYGISTWVDANGVLIQGNHIQANKEEGVWLSSFWGSSFIGNTVEGNIVDTGESQLQMTLTQGSLFAGNYFEGSGAAIRINAGNHAVSIIGNRAQVATEMILVSHSGATHNHDITIIGNHVPSGKILVIGTTDVDYRFFLSGNYSVDTADPYTGLSNLLSYTLSHDDYVFKGDVSISDELTVATIDLTEGQIAFPATQSPSASVNTLDDYEEETWTLTIEFGGASVDVTYAGGGQSGTYTKIGNRVFFEGTLILTNKGTSNGNATIEGLPFTAAGEHASVAWVMENVTFANVPMMMVIATTTQINLYEITEAGTNTTLTDANFANNSVVRVSGNYGI